MKKIAIKYSEENWPEIKKAVDLIRSIGKSVERRKDGRPSSNGKYCLQACTSESMGLRHGDFYYDLIDGFKDSEILTMPQDIPKLKEVLGIEAQKYIKRIGADIQLQWSNGRHGEIFPVHHSEKFWYYVDESRCINKECAEPSTKEAYEAQEAKKKLKEIGAEFVKSARNYKPLNFHGHWMCPCAIHPYKSNKEFEEQMKQVQLITENAELKQTIKTLSSTADKLANENAELAKKLYKIKGLL